MGSFPETLIDTENSPEKKTMHLCVISRELVQTESAVFKKALYKKYLIIIP